MFPGCIRGPRSSQGSTDDITKQTKSIVQVSLIDRSFIKAGIFEIFEKFTNEIDVFFKIVEYSRLFTMEYGLGFFLLEKMTNFISLAERLYSFFLPESK